MSYTKGDYAYITGNTSGHQFSMGTRVRLEHKFDERSLYMEGALGDRWFVNPNDLMPEMKTNREAKSLLSLNPL